MRRPARSSTPQSCNEKLIGAQRLHCRLGRRRRHRSTAVEFNSPRDFDGHGTPHRSTAGGNFAFTDGRFGAAREINGMRPARRGDLQGLLGIAGDGGGVHSDRVAAIDQAVADGVDVINFSISGTRRTSSIRSTSRSSSLPTPASSWPPRPATRSGAEHGREPGPVDHDRRGRAHTTGPAVARSRSARRNFLPAHRPPTPVTGPFIDSVTAGLAR